MSVPDFQSLMLPVLKAISDGHEHSNREITDLIAHEYRLSEEEMQQMLPSGQAILTNRLAWAKVYLKKAGLLESPARGRLRITGQGKSILDRSPESITIRYLKEIPSFQNWRRSKKDGEAIYEETTDTVVETGRTPEELLESSYATLREELAATLIDRIRACSPVFFERLVVQLLVKMGYGGSLVDAGLAVGRSGDDGIDGIIKEDKLGLDVVCIQAKRWEANVGRPVVQAFAGSMEGHRARKGVLITTSEFSRDAIDYVSRIERKIVLIDGATLAGFMIDYDIGVTTSRAYAVKKVDSDFFVEEED